MKNSWVKTSEGLPHLHIVSDAWQMSTPILITSIDRSVYVANLQLYDGKYEWVVGDYKQSFDFATEWQPIELSEPDQSKIRDELRETQNYCLNT